MTPKEIVKRTREAVEADIDRIIDPYKKQIKELRRQLGWCHWVIGFMRICIVLAAGAVLIWATI
jgi:hypothetical protein